MASSDKYCWTHKSMRNILRVYLELIMKNQIKIGFFGFVDRKTNLILSCT